ncbi:hypothetical protein HDU76_004693 [Blyttiomyces sp. JEL0837]|nr:hypothetical protein HDU76_004693 [Blyttiomyces sp. JEL0837]
MTVYHETLPHQTLDIAQTSGLPSHDKSNAPNKENPVIAAPEIELKWNSVKYVVPFGKHGERKILLDGVSGSVHEGQVVAVMGSSGSGKSTLLNCLAGRIADQKGSELSGDILFNGKRRSKGTWRKICAYVEQMDLMFTDLTVEETLTYAATLRLPSYMSSDEKWDHVNSVIMQLGLDGCRKTRIGDSIVRGISGGERKRVSIGIELVTDPKVLFLDEPTTGLDAATSLALLKLIKNMARERGMIVLMTIHQPRVEVLDLLDSLIILSRGKTMWFGPTSDALTHFSRLGFNLPPKTNPTDFFLDIVTFDARTQELKETTTGRIELFDKEWRKLSEADKSELVTSSTPQFDIEDDERWSLSWFSEAAILLERNMKDLGRNAESLWVTVGQSVFIVILMGFTFFKVDNDDAGIQTRLGLWLQYVSIICYSFKAVMQNEFNDLVLRCNPSLSTCPPNNITMGNDVVLRYNLDSPSITVCVIINIVLSLVFLISGILKPIRFESLKMETDIGCIMGGDSHHHRSSLKQSNKSFKSKHATKGQLKAVNKGRVERAPVKSVKHRTSSKADRRNAAKLAQQKKREEAVSNARLFSGTNAPPKIVSVIPLCPDVDPQDFINDLYDAMDLPRESVKLGSVTLPVERFRQKLKLIPCSRRLMDILDAVRVSDFVVLLMSAAVEVDEEGTQALTAIKAQGVPTIFGAVQHLEKDAPKMQVAVRKSLLSYLEAHFPGFEAKVYSTSQQQEALTFLRTITTMRPKPLVWRDKHSYLLADDVEFVPNPEDASVGSLKVGGFVRGTCLSANRLVHLQGFGNFQIKMITSYPVIRDGETIEPSILHVPDAEQQETLISENIPDPMEGEQTWPTEEEIAEADARVAAMGSRRRRALEEGPKKKTIRVPKGTSSYQAAWIVDEEDEEASDEDEDEDDDDDGDDVEMMEGGYEFGNGDEMGESDDDGMDDRVVPDEDEEYEEIEAEEKVDDFDVDFNAADDDRQYREYLEEKKKAAETDLAFPDEVDTPKDIPARQRFARYRGLKSFRTSPWDPYENLPIDYARIFQFENFKKTKTKILRDAEESIEGVATGRRVVVWIDMVPQEVALKHQNSQPFFISSLLPHEQKMTLSSCNIHRVDPVGTSENPAPIIKSKEPVIVWSGFRKYVVQPIYSADTRGSSNNVHKFDRFLHHGRNVLASFYGPITFCNEPVLLFRTEEDGKHILTATGHVTVPAPLRIVAKRILLTGHPFKIHKRSAVIRYMFFNPTDVEYFKPIQLSTKMGRIGHIKESLGTHGYMKCLFDEQIKQQDTVCLSLYKRVFPKWNTKMWVDDGAENWKGGSGSGVARVIDDGDVEMD